MMEAGPKRAGTSTRENELATAEPTRPTVALLPWGQVIEDYLDTIGMEPNDFVHSLDGGWMFGFVDALATAGIGTTIVWPSRAVRRPERHLHHRTGAPVWFIPPTRTWRLLRRAVDDPYARHPADAAPQRSRAARAIAAVAHTTLPWVATPIRDLVHVLRVEHASVLLCQDYEEARFDTCIARRRALGIPVFAVFQGGILQRTPLERFMRPRAIRAADGLVIGASTEAQRVRDRYGVGDEHVTRALNPLPLDQWPVGDRTTARVALGIPLDAAVVSWHGRVLIGQKGLDVLLDAWESLTRDQPGRDLVLLLTGAGQDSGQLREELERRRLRGVRWSDDYVADRAAIQERLAAADLAVLASRAEGFAVAPLEAMASGRALVATAAPGVTDLAPRGEDDGVVVVPVGDASALATAIAGVLDDPGRAARLGAAARARVGDGFSLDVVGRQLAACFGLSRDDDVVAESAKARKQAVQSPLRRGLTRVARRAGRFLGVTDLARAVDTTRAELHATQSELAVARDELHRRAQLIEEEQHRLQHARAVWVTSTYLAATPIPVGPLVSVVLPTRNRAALVTRAVDSVVTQSYPNWELIVVIDGSDDGTLEALERYDDPRITVLYQEHQGQATARNAALEKASGDYVVYLDDDNLMYEHWLRGVVWAFTVHPDTDVIIGARLIDDEYRGRHLPGGAPPFLSYRDRIDRDELARGNQADLMQLAHRRSVGERFDREDSPYEDWGFLARVVRDRDPVCFPALAGIYTTTAPDRQMDLERALLERQVRRLQRKLG